MTESDLKAIVASVAKKNPLFRPITTTLHDRGANVEFADIQDRDPRTISGWFENAGGMVMYIGREWKINGFVMYVELRA
jgi:hypothetical protein